MKTKALYYGDHPRRYLADPSVDLVCLGRPFSSNRPYSVIKDEPGDRTDAQQQAERILEALGQEWMFGS